MALRFSYTPNIFLMIFFHIVFLKREAVLIQFTYKFFLNQLLLNISFHYRALSVSHYFEGKNESFKFYISSTHKYFVNTVV